MKLEKKWKIGLAIFIAITMLSSILFYVAKPKTTSMVAEDIETRMARSYQTITRDDMVSEEYSDIKFGAYFEKDINGDGVNEHVLGSYRNLWGSDTLIMDLSVGGNVTLKNAYIAISGSNFKLRMSTYADSVVKNNYVSDNVRKIEFNEINPGTQRLIMGTTSSSVSGIEEYSKNATVSLYGVCVVDGETPESEEPQLIKSYDLTIEWYGEASARFTNVSRKEYNYKSHKDASTLNKELEFEFTLRRYEEEKALTVKSQKINVEIPTLKNRYPDSVVCNKGNWEYNEETHRLSISKDVHSNYESYKVTLKYPDEVYNEIIKDNQDGVVAYLYPKVTGYLECYNNPGYSEPYKTNTASAYPVIQIGREEQYVGEYSVYVSVEDNKYYSNHYKSYVWSKQEILDAFDSVAEPDSIEYHVNWSIYRNKNDIATTTLIISDKGDSFGGMYTTKNIGLYFKNTGLIPDNGTIKIYNAKTDEVVKELTNGEWKNYTEQNPLYYDSAIKEIRIETTECSSSKSSLNIVAIKELDVKEIKQTLTRAELEDADYFNSSARFSGINIANSYTAYDNLRMVSRKSHATIEIDSDCIAAGALDAKRNIKITIPHEDVTYGNWKDGKFLIEIPEEIIAMTLDNVTVSDTQIKIKSATLYKNDENNKYYIEIETENANETSAFKIDIACSMRVDDTCPTKAVPINMYMKNDILNIYYTSSRDVCDMDRDENTLETVGYATTELQINASDGFISGEQLLNYDDKNSIKRSAELEPAEVDPERRQATISVYYANNYKYKASNIKIIGKIPFEGNTYSNGRTLYSTFSTTMTNEGITLQDGLEGKATIYYSEKANPTEDLNDSENGWMLSSEVTEYNKIKSYLVIVNDGFSRGRFNYNINIPANVKLNEKTFSTHKVSYDLTIDGALSTGFSVEPRKLGMVISRYYKMDINKYKENTTLGIKGAAFSITEINEENERLTKVSATNESGIVSFNKLRINQEYTFKEISSPESYELNKKAIVFKVAENEQTKEIEYVQVSEDGFDGNVNIEQDENGIVVKSSMYNTPKYILNVIKVEENSSEIDISEKTKLSNIMFSLNGVVYTTNENGEFTTKILDAGKEYILSEIYANGYYLKDITFSVEKNEDGSFRIISENPEMLAANIINNPDEDLVQISVVISNEKIPTFNLEVIKVAENNKEEDWTKLDRLSNAKFILYNEDTNKEIVYKTDEEGKFSVSGLSQYVEGKYLKARYVLKEKEAPAGYENNAEDISFQIINNNGVVSYSIADKENKATIRDVFIDGENVTIIIQDRPLFKITKVDDKGNPLANVGFIIKDVATGGYAKDVNGNYVGELNENGQYIVRTDSDGTISLPLKDGRYEMVEVEFIEGFDQNVKTEYFEIKTEERKNNDPTAGGSQEENIETDTIQISTIPELVAFAESVNNGTTYSGKIVELMNDLDFENDEYDAELKSALTSNAGFTPIGTSSNPFRGTFKGNYHQIKNLYINCDDKLNVALFGLVSDGVIKELGVSGSVTNSTEDTNSCTAGLVATALNTTISNCYNKCTVNGKGYTGGISGVCSNKTIKYSFNAGEINSEYVVGGISGNVLSATISECYNKGNITSTSNVAGGITGINGTIDYCYNLGNISSAGSVAGGINGEYGTISNCYNVGNVVCNGGTVGKIVGLGGNVTNSYYKATGDDTDTNGTPKTEIEMKSSEFVDALGKEKFSKVTEDVNNGYPSLYNVAIDNSNVLEIGTVDEFMQFASDVNNGNSYLGKNIKLTSDIDFGDSLKNVQKTRTVINVDSVVGLVDIARYVNNGSNDYKDTLIVLTKDLDFKNDEYNESLKSMLTDESGAGFTPIGNSYSNTFKGLFDGQGHTISNLYINSSSQYVGLFGYTTDALVCNVTVTGTVKATSTSACAGGIIGYASRTSIANCRNKATVDSQKYAGGIVGEEYGCYCFESCINEGNINGKSCAGGLAGCLSSSSNTSINSCYNIADVSSEGNAGGIAGTCGKNIISCYNLGTISGSNMIGGIAGSISANVRNCYNVGNINGSGKSYGYMGGIVGHGGSSGNVFNCYNIGDITGSSGYYAEPIVYGGNANNCYYLDEITRYPDRTASKGIAVSAEDMKSEDFISMLQGEPWEYDSSSANKGFPIMKQDNSIANNVRNIYNEVGWTSIGTKEHPFCGTFDGQGYTIKNMYIASNESYIGVFGYTKCAQFKNIKVEGNISTLKTGYIGGVVGYVESSELQLTNCEFIGEIWSINANIGGIVGYINAEYNDSVVISNCRTEAKIKGDRCAGIVGYIYSTSSGVAVRTDAKINDCNNSGTITGSNIGGIVAYIDECTYTIKNCKNTANMYDGVGGGIIGGSDHGGSIEGNISFENCINEGNFNVSSRKTGGIAGSVYVTSQGEIIAKSCINKGKNPGGGIIGETTNGSVYISNCENEAECYVSGIIGMAYASISPSVTIENCINKKDATIIGMNTDVAGIVGFIQTKSARVENCRNEAIVNNGGGQSTGGIVGKVQGGTTSVNISNCVNTGKIYGKENAAAGIISWSNASGLTISNCKNIGEISGEGSNHLAGIATRIESGGDIYNCTNEGKIFGSGRGVYIGGVFSTSGHVGNVINCTNSGDINVFITDYSNIGGIASGRGDNLVSCKNYGNITVTGGSAQVGGIMGYERLFKYRRKNNKLC